MAESSSVPGPHRRMVSGNHSSWRKCPVLRDQIDLPFRHFRLIQMRGCQYWHWCLDFYFRNPPMPIVLGEDEHLNLWFPDQIIQIQELPTYQNACITRITRQRSDMFWLWCFNRIGFTGKVARKWKIRHVLLVFLRKGCSSGRLTCLITHSYVPFTWAEYWIKGLNRSNVCTWEWARTTSDNLYYTHGNVLARPIVRFTIYILYKYLHTRSGFGFT